MLASIDENVKTKIQTSKCLKIFMQNMYSGNPPLSPLSNPPSPLSPPSPPLSKGLCLFVIEFLAVHMFVCSHFLNRNYL